MRIHNFNSKQSGNMEMGSKYHFSNIIGRSDAIKGVFAAMERAIDSSSDVLITGETGTGKELVATEIHYNSPREDKPLLVYNCGAIPRKLVASILFGHRKGAFTEAIENKIGLFEAASEGTVILDEIGDTPLDVQPNLLRMLEERKVQRLGETTSRDVDVRMIAISNRELSKEVEAGRFREDLYSRLNRFNIHLPPLRERLEDIPLLAEHFYREACRQSPRDLDGFDTPSLVSIRFATQPKPQPKGFAPDVLGMFQSYPWPGNVRELRSAIHRACALAEEGECIQRDHLPQALTNAR